MIKNKKIHFLKLIFFCLCLKLNSKGFDLRKNNRFIFMKDTKRARIFRELKQLVLTAPGGVSRGDAAERLGVDLRTASTYLEQLASNGLLCCETEKVTGKGRPHTVYRSNANSLAFLGLQMQNNLAVYAAVTDAAGKLLRREELKLPESASRLSAFAAILDLVNRACNNEKYCLYGIGLAISRWLQPPLAGEDVYANLADYLERETGLAVYRDVNINAVAFDLARQLDCRDLALVHTGKVIEFGLVRDGHPAGDFAKREAWLSHLCVNPDGRRCYCGKYGCLENYVTFGARHERLKVDNSPATLRMLGNMLGVAIVRLVKKYPVKCVVLMGCQDIFPAAEEYFASRITTGVHLLCHRQNHPVEYGAALMSAHMELHRFTEDI